MTQLTAHFTLEELTKDAPIPEECVPIFVEMCAKILEPIRSVFDKPLIITSGYRSIATNAEAHGVPDSEHIASPMKCAVDFYFEGISSRFVFDWLRNSPSLPYHQLILEHNAKGGNIIHVSINKTLPGVRSVLEGATHNTEGYQRASFIPFNPGTADEIPS